VATDRNIRTYVLLRFYKYGVPKATMKL